MIKAGNFIKTTLMGGLLVVLPIVLTFMFLRWIFHLVTGLIAPLTRIIVAQTDLQKMVGDAISVLLIILVFFLVGLSVKTRLGRYLFCRLEKHNIEKIGIPSDHYRIIKGDYNRSVIQLSREGFKFDVIFLDPPYSLLEVANPVKILYKRDVLAEGGIIVLERPTPLKFKAGYFDLYREHRVGQKTLNFYRHEPAG